MGTSLYKNQMETVNMMPGFGLAVMNMLTIIRAYSVGPAAADMNYAKFLPIPIPGGMASQLATGSTVGPTQKENRSSE